jgi:hypothetical protein
MMRKTSISLGDVEALSGNDGGSVTSLQKNDETEIAVTDRFWLWSNSIRFMKFPILFTLLLIFWNLQIILMVPGYEINWGIMIWIN